MILRIANGHVASGRLADVAASYRERYVPVASTTAGLGRFYLGARPVEDGHRIALMTIWSSLDAAMVAFGGDLTSLRTLDAADHGEQLIDVDFYEVEAAPRPAEAEARSIRLSAGRVARGMDADIQHALREEVPNLPAQCVEGWVGRRVLGTDVEIAFVSTWSREPEGRRLDEPLWPAISARYDTFRLEVLEIVLHGEGRPEIE
jgi:hypothetical protein